MNFQVVMAFLASPLWLRVQSEPSCTFAMAFDKTFFGDTPLQRVKAAFISRSWTENILVILDCECGATVQRPKFIT